MKKFKKYLTKKEKQTKFKKKFFKKLLTKNENSI